MNICIKYLLCTTIITRVIHKLLCIRTYAPPCTCNSNKTKFILFQLQSRSRCPSSSFSISFGGSVLCPVDTALNLGVIWDKHLKMKSHISNVCKVASFALSRIGALYSYLDKSSIERLVHAFISCRLDYCNALFYGMPDSELNRLQRIQNMAARMIVGAKWSEHITPILIKKKKLRWLPVKARIDYKILLITFKTICGYSPKYLYDLIQLCQYSYNLRSSSSTNLLLQPRTRYIHYGDRTFSYAAPRLWNSLPNYIRNSNSVGTYKIHIKTHLFKMYYN